MGQVYSMDRSRDIKSSLTKRKATKVPDGGLGGGSDGDGNRKLEFSGKRKEWSRVIDAVKTHIEL